MKFFNILAHDLRNPFNIIMGYADILSADFNDLTDQTKKEYINQISVGADSAYRLLNNLLEWARSQTGRTLFTPLPIDLLLPLNNSLQVVAPQAQAKGVRFITENSGDTFVFADMNMVRTVFRNLLTNAIKFSYPGSVVKIITEEIAPGHPDLLSDEQNSYIKVTVEDHGTGIEPSDVTKLFMIGEKVRTDGTANETGTGIGLLLCHEFILKNKGRIWVTSRLGEGSSFMFILPKSKQPQV